MTQDEKWIARYNEVKDFIETNLMDFRFGGFLGYGKGVPGGLVNEELKRRKMLDG